MYTRLIDQLTRKIAEHAEASLSRPQGHEGFDYGKAVGFYQGLKTALSVVQMEINRDQEEEDRAEKRDDEFER
jgi:hypothetical protein